MDNLLLSKKEIRSVKARELVIYREKDIVAYPPDEAIAEDQLKKVVEAISKNGWWNNGQSCYCLSKEFYMRLKKIAGIK